MDKKAQLSTFVQFLNEAEKGVKKESEKQVMIAKAINLKLMCDYVVSCSYGDIVLIICMLRDYVKMLDEVRSDNIQWETYYREKFIKMADRLSEQIEYDYDAAVEKCRKKLGQKERYSDVGGEAIALTIKYDKGKKKKEESHKQCNDENSNKPQERNQSEERSKS